MSIWMILRNPPASAENPSPRSSVPIAPLSRSLARRGCASRVTACRRIGNGWRRPTPPANLSRQVREQQRRVACISAALCSLPTIRCRRSSLPEHSHIPLSRKTPFPGGGDLPKQYYDAMDPFVVLAAASQVTKTIKLGTGVLLVQQRDAIQTAKLVASIDQASQGRFLFGVGGGWNQDEMEDHGTVYASRFKRMREAIEAMKEIWTKPEAEYHGE